MSDTAAPAALSPTQLLEVVKDRLVAAFDGPVVVEGVVVEHRVANGGFMTVTLGDVAPGGRYPTRLSVNMGPREARAVLPAALEPQTRVQAEGSIDLWINRAQVQLRATTLVRVGAAATREAYEAAQRAIAEERLGEVVPRLPLFLSRLLLLAPVGTTLGDLTRDLGGWQPPLIVHRSLPGDSPDLGALVERGVASALADGEGPFDLVAVMRGGAIEPISGWDDVELLRAVDRLQRGGLPVLVAVGHADHTPLIYRVAGYRVRHTAEAGRWLADHNLGAAQRIRGLDVVGPVLAARVAAERERVGRVRVALGVAVAARLAELRRRVAPAAAPRAGVTRGLALVAAPAGGPAGRGPGAAIVLETADATVTATIDTVHRHAVDADTAGPAPAHLPEGSHG
ncbi:MAG: hypothetical protein ACO3RG_05950 [Nitriliruptoraceae bacterium]